MIRSARVVTIPSGIMEVRYRAPAVGGIAYRAYCTFNDADATSLDAYSWANAGDVRPGVAQWVETAGDWSIASGRTSVPTPAAINFAVLACGAAAGTLSCIVRIGGVASTVPRGIRFRYNTVGGSGFMCGLMDSGTAVFGIWEYPGPTLRASTPFTPTGGVDYTIQVVLSGNDMTGTVDGGNTISYSSATNNTQENHGLQARRANDSFENFYMI